MSTRSAKSSNSSSQSKTVSWQPSQEANLKTPMRGLRVVISLLLARECALKMFRTNKAADSVESENRTVFTDEVRPQLTTTAQTHAALHVAFDGQINPFGRQAAG